MEVKVNLESDWSAGVLTHYAVAPWEGIFFPIVTISIEMIVRQHWLFYSWHKFSDNKGSRTPPGLVKHKDLFICLEGHDVGPFTFDITPLVPLNLWYAIIWPFSKRKMVFGAGTVQMNGKPTGLAQTFNWPIIPMLTCGEPISAPTAFVLTNAFHTVIVGMTFWDLLAGLANILVTMAIDLIFAKLKFGKIKLTSVFGQAMQKGAARLENTVLKEGMKKIEQKFGQQAVAAASKAFIDKGESATLAAGEKVLADAARQSLIREMRGKVTEKLFGYGKDGFTKQTVAKLVLNGAGDGASSLFPGRKPSYTVSSGGLAKVGVSSDKNAQGETQYGPGGQTVFANNNQFKVAAPIYTQPKHP